MSDTTWTRKASVQEGEKRIQTLSTRLMSVNSLNNSMLVAHASS